MASSNSYLQVRWDAPRMQDTLKLDFNGNSAWAPTQRLLCSHRRVADVHGRAPWAGQNLLGDHLLGFDTPPREGHFKL